MTPRRSVVHVSSVANSLSAPIRPKVLISTAWIACCDPASKPPLSPLRSGFTSCQRFILGLLKWRGRPPHPHPSHSLLTSFPPPTAHPSLCKTCEGDTRKKFLSYGGKRCFCRCAAFLALFRRFGVFYCLSGTFEPRLVFPLKQQIISRAKR